MTETIYSNWLAGYRVLTGTYDALYNLQRSYTRVTPLGVDGTEPPTPATDYWVDYDTIDPIALCDLHREALMAVRDGAVDEWYAARCTADQIVSVEPVAPRPMLAAIMVCVDAVSGDEAVAS